MNTPIAEPTALSLETLRSNPPRNLSLKEAAAYIGISERKLWAVANRPGSALRPARIGRRLIFIRENVDKYLALLSARCA